MTSDELGRIAYEAWWNTGYAETGISWKELSRESRAAWIAAALAVAAAVREECAKVVESDMPDYCDNLGQHQKVTQRIAAAIRALNRREGT